MIKWMSWVFQSREAFWNDQWWQKVCRWQCYSVQGFIETPTHQKPCHSPLLEVSLLSIQGGLDVFITFLCSVIRSAVKASYWTSLPQLGLITVTTTVALVFYMLYNCLLFGVHRAGKPPEPLMMPNKPVRHLQSDLNIATQQSSSASVSQFIKQLVLKLGKNTSCPLTAARLKVQRPCCHNVLNFMFPGRWRRFYFWNYLFQVQHLSKV